MNLNEIKIHANNIKKYSDLVVKQYKEIHQILIHIYNICYKYNLSSKKLVDLINKYSSMISLLSNDYKNIANNLLNYVDSSNQSLDELEIGVTNIVQIFNDSINV